MFSSEKILSLNTDEFSSIIRPVVYSLVEDDIRNRFLRLGKKTIDFYDVTSEKWMKLIHNSKPDLVQIKPASDF